MLLVYPFYLLFFVLLFRIFKIKANKFMIALIILLPWCGFIISKPIAYGFCKKNENFILQTTLESINLNDYNIISTQINFNPFFDLFISGKQINAVDKNGKVIMSENIIYDKFGYPFLNTGSGEFWFQSTKKCGDEYKFNNKIFYKEQK